jgi:hypothetical protein
MLAVMRLLLAAFLLLVLPAGASAAELTLQLESSGVNFGAKHQASGALTEAGAPLAGQTIQIEGRRYPFSGDFESIGQTTTDAQGRYAFRGRFDHNVQLRAFAPAQNVRSPLVRAYVFPRQRLSFDTLRGDSIRITQSYRVPAGTRLSAPTLFYVGRAKARLLPLVGRAKPRRTGRGRYRATLVYELPGAWNGRFRYGTCFRYSEGSGLGDPRAGCPRRYRFGG